MDERFQLISALGIVPTFKMDDSRKAVPLARAMTAGGLPIAEISFRTAAAAESIRRISSECPEVLVGAGDVLTCKQVDQALEAGGMFISTPGFAPEVIHYARSKGALVIPCISTAEEAEQAANMGIFVGKSGKAAIIDAPDDSWRKRMWIPIGEIGTVEMNRCLSRNRVLAYGGSWMTRQIQNEDWSGISSLCKETVRGLLDFRVVHVGLNCKEATEAEKIARLFCRLFDVPYLPNETAIFAGSLVECIKGPYRGAHGHIAIGTGNVDRAVYQLEKRGAVFDVSSRKTDAEGHTLLIYLQEEIGGFALHLVKNKP